MDQQHQQDEQEEDDTIIKSIGWSVEWTRAFPTLVSCNVYCPPEFAKYLYHTAWNSISLDEAAVVTRTTTTSSKHEAITKWHDSLGYGEIPPQAIFEIIIKLQQQEQTEKNDVPFSLFNASTIKPPTNDPKEEESPSYIYDLGSGRGHVLFALALCLPHAHGCAGIEIVPSLHQQATTVWKTKWWQPQGRAAPQIHDNAPAAMSFPPPLSFVCNDFTLLAKEIQSKAALVIIHATVFQNAMSFPPPLSFVCNDFTLLAKEIQSKAALVVIHATVFQNDLFEQVEEICQACRKGTQFLLVSRPLKESETMRTLQSFSVKLSWGLGTLYLQKKVA